MHQGNAHPGSAFPIYIKNCFFNSSVVCFSSTAPFMHEANKLVPHFTRINNRWFRKIDSTIDSVDIKFWWITRRTLEEIALFIERGQFDLEGVTWFIIPNITYRTNAIVASQNNVVGINIRYDEVSVDESLHGSGYLQLVCIRWISFFTHLVKLFLTISGWKSVDDGKVVVIKGFQVLDLCILSRLAMFQEGASALTAGLNRCIDIWIKHFVKQDCNIYSNSINQNNMDIISKQYITYLTLTCTE